MPDYNQWVAIANRIVARFGQLTPAKLRRGTTDRPCKAVMLDYDPREVELRAEGARRFVISTFDPTTNALLAMPPDFELDKIVYAGKVYNFTSPDEGPRPAGPILYHDMPGVYSADE